MKDFSTRYVRRYTALDGLQPAYAVEYCLVAADQALALRVSRSDGRVCDVPVPRGGEPFARCVLRYLYENAVLPETALDVVRDCYGA